MCNKKLKLTNGSSDEIMKWHGGSGRVWISEGTGNCLRSFDFQFFKSSNDGKYRLGLGNKSAIVLEDWQADIIGCYAYDEGHEK